MQTTMGDMVIRLSDSTPLHRDNFLKAGKSWLYDSRFISPGNKKFYDTGR
jgi:hypothetical protein